MTTSFTSFGLPEALTHTLAHMRYSEPTPIQSQAIPVALAGKDILGSAQTGTGKTAAFSVPLVARIMSTEKSGALVLTPTRELAVQVMEVIQNMIGKNSKIKTSLLIGGASMQAQIKQLKMFPRIIVGTPGRVNDHLERRSLKLQYTDFLVLDETDRMLDMGFSIQLERIFKYLPEERQTLMFSATLPKNIVNLANKYLKTPERIAVGSTTQAIPKIKQDLIQTTDADKYALLLEELEKRNGSIIIFTKTKHGADRLCEKLNKKGHDSDSIHGDLKQNQRKRVIDKFRDMEFRILVATDVAARGLDISHIEHVINYDLPQCPEDYIHRIGRTGRAGAEGSALCLISPADKKKWRAIEKMMNPNGKPLPMQSRKAAPGSEKLEERSEQKNKQSFGNKQKFEDRKFEKKKFEGRDRFKKNDFRKDGFKKNNDFKQKNRHQPDVDSELERLLSEDYGQSNKTQQKPERARDFDRTSESGERRNYGPKKSFGERKFGGKRSFGNKKSFGERREFSNNEGFEGNRQDGDKPFKKKSFGGKPYGKKPFGKKPFGERREQPEGGNFESKRQDGDRPFKKKSFGGKPFGKRPFGKKPFGGQNSSGKPSFKFAKRS